MSEAFGPVVDTAWLHDHFGDQDLYLADCRWYLDEPDRGLAEYRSGHLPGAVHFSLDDDLSAADGPGRHPLPPPEVFTETLQAKGISNGHTVVAYDDQGGAIAARLWWLLGNAGHRRVAVLDGGMPAWVAANGRITDTVEEPIAAEFVAKPPGNPTIDREALYAYLGELTLVDARAAERYRGETEPIDAIAGHVPTALSAPYSGNLNPDGTFRRPADLASRFAELGIQRTDDVVVYCGSGVTACHDILALQLAGLGMATLYPGSWSDWSTAGFPVATGD